MFNTAKEKYAYKQGIKKGRKGGKVWHKKKPRIYRQKYSPYSSKPKTPKAGAYNMHGRINENMVDDRSGPVVFWEGDDFDFGSKGATRKKSYKAKKDRVKLTTYYPENKDSRFVTTYHASYADAENEAMKNAKRIHIISSNKKKYKFKKH